MRMSIKNVDLPENGLEMENEPQEDGSVMQVTPRGIVIAAILLLAIGMTAGWFLVKYGLPAVQLPSQEAKSQEKTPVEPEKPDPKAVWRSLEKYSNHSVSGLELPAPTEVPANCKYIFVTAKCKNEVKWLVTGQKTDILESKQTNTIMVFPNDSELITIVAYTVVDGKPSDPAITSIKVMPEPKKEELPASKKEVKNDLLRHVTIIDKDKKSANDALRSWLRQNEMELHELVAGSPEVESLHLKQYVEKFGVPVVVIQNGSGEILFADKFLNGQQVKDAVKPK